MIHTRSKICHFTSFVVLSVGLCSSSYSQDNGPLPSAQRAPNPFGLPRLTGSASDTGDDRLASGTYEILQLSLPNPNTVSSQATLKHQGAVPYIDIEGTAMWSHILRPSRTGIRYVTATFAASPGTVVEFCGLKLGIIGSLDDPAYAALMRSTTETNEDDWEPLNHETQMLPFGGRLRALLAPITAKLDYKAGRGSVWISDTMLGNEFPLPTPSADSVVSITAGEGGVWLCGLASGEENPIFQDSNYNDVPDAFERSTFGGLLRQDISEHARAELYKTWIDARTSEPAAEYVITVPAPDFLPDFCGREGIAPAHNMPNAFRSRSPSTPTSN